MIAASLLIALLATRAPAHSSVAMTLSPPARLTVGDRFQVSLVVTSPSRSLITGPLADSLGVFVVAGESRKTRARSGHDESTYRLSLAGFRPGRQPLPLFAFLVQSGATTDTLITDTASVTIASVLPAKMQDINGLAAAEAFPNRLLWVIPGALLLLAALVYLGRRLYRRFRTIQELAAAPLPPWDEALAALDATPWHEWLEAGQVKRYYYALSQILKRYIERRFEFHAVEQTTTELLASMRIHKTPMREDVARFFSRLDLVKYAKSVPPADEAESAIAKVRDFVLKTKPQAPPPAPAAVGTSPAPATGSA
jgi:hypothetical protein